MYGVHEGHKLFVENVYLWICQVNLARAITSFCRTKMLEMFHLFLELGVRDLKVPAAISAGAKATESFRLIKFALKTDYFMVHTEFVNFIITILLGLLINLL